MQNDNTTQAGNKPGILAKRTCQKAEVVPLHVIEKPQPTQDVMNTIAELSKMAHSDKLQGIAVICLLSDGRYKYDYTGAVVQRPKTAIAALEKLKRDLLDEVAFNELV